MYEILYTDCEAYGKKCTLGCKNIGKESIFYKYFILITVNGKILQKSTEQIPPPHIHGAQ